MSRSPLLRLGERVLALRSASLRHSATMLVGTGASQVILLLALPVLSRVYSPTAFGVFAAYTAIAAVLSRIASGCYEQAVLVPADDEDARGLAILSIGLAAIVSGILLVVLTRVAGPLSRLLGTPAIRSSYWLIPVLVFVQSAQESLSYWFNRQKQYRLLAGNRIARSLVTVAAMLALAAGSRSGVMLVLATVLGTAVGLANLAAAWLWQARSRTRLTLSAALRLAYRYRDFAVFSAPGSLLNSASSQSPVFLLGLYFGPMAVGAYNFTWRVLSGPQVVVATAVGDVFRQRAAEELLRTGNCRALWRKTFAVLVAVSVPMYGLLFLVAPRLFVIVFGPQWRTAGEYARMLAPLFLLAWPASTLSRVHSVAERQREDFVWQIALLVVTVGALVVGGHVGRSTLAVLLYSLSYSAMYLVYLVMSYRYCVLPPRALDAPPRPMLEIEA